jgi:nicotinamidase-related amidase
VPNRPGSFRGRPETIEQLVLEIDKTNYSVTSNANFRAVLDALGASRVVLFGVATEFCVKESALALRKLGLAVDLVIDAIRAITPEGGQKAIEEMVAAGVRLVTTEEVCSTTLQPAVVGEARE